MSVGLKIKNVLKRVLPPYTKRRLAAALALTALTRPNRLFQRLNARNIFLYKQFSQVTAHCCICGKSGPLFYDMPDLKLRQDHGIGVLRETLLCHSCASSNRQRTLAYTLMTTMREHFGCRGSTLRDLIQGSSQIEIWDTDAFSPLSRILLSIERGVLSKFVPDQPFGVELDRKVFNIDLQNISFESDRFDVILSSDIMEHVRNDHAAHAEIFRCLRPGGVYIFTVPYMEDHARTQYLVDASSSRDVFLTPPHYHGDPITGGILAYRIYGRELIDELTTIGFEVRFSWTELAAEGIFSGDCFVAIKPRDRVEA